jgi:hypothetical protein
MKPPARFSVKWSKIVAVLEAKLIRDVNLNEGCA